MWVPEEPRLPGEHEVEGCARSCVHRWWLVAANHSRGLEHQLNVRAISEDLRTRHRRELRLVSVRPRDDPPITEHHKHLSDLGALDLGARVHQSVLYICREGGIRIWAGRST